MAIIDNLEIYVVSTATGERLQEYGNPERDAIEGQNAVEKYIEAESNVEFSIVVVLNAGFNYHKADGVKIFVTLDGTTRTKFYPKPSINIKADCLTKKFKLERKDMTLKRDGNWFRSRFSFGLVTVDESLRADAITLEKQMKTLGSIAVVVQRVSSKCLDEPRSWDGRLEHEADGVDKKLIIKNISHSFRPVGEVKLSRPPCAKTVETPIRGRYGHQSKVVYQYRSHLALQYLGCIPTTPPPVPLSERAPAEMTDEEKSSEIIRMRTEILSQKGEIEEFSRAIQALHGEINEAKQIKERMTILQAALGGLSAVTAPTLTASTTLTPTVRTPIVKREHLKDESQDDIVALTSHPAKRSKPVYVDLDD